MKSDKELNVILKELIEIKTQKEMKRLIYITKNSFLEKSGFKKILLLFISAKNTGMLNTKHI